MFGPQGPNIIIAFKLSIKYVHAFALSAKCDMNYISLTVLHFLPNESMIRIQFYCYHSYQPLYCTRAAG